MTEIGKKIWVVPDCFYPEASTEGPYISHEAICVINTGNIDAEIRLTPYFENSEPDEAFIVYCSARRTNHIRLDKIKNSLGEGMKKNLAYAIVVESNVPIICQYTRVDTTQERLGLATTMMYSFD